MNSYQSIATITAPEFINLQPLDINPMMSKCEIKVLYLGKNRNGTSINKDAATEMAKTLRGAPIVGYYREDKGDFFDHGDQVIMDGDGVHFKSLTKPYGFVAPDADVWFQEFEEFDESGESVTRVYLMTTGYLWTGQYEEAKQLFMEGGKPQSMELDENSLTGFWAKEANSDYEFFIINDAIFSKLCILGDDVEPCFEGSSITAPNISKTFSLDDNFKRTLYSMMKELQYTLQGGSQKMADINEEVTEVVQDEVTEAAEATEEVTEEVAEETAVAEEATETEISEVAETVEENLGNIDETVAPENEVSIEEATTEFAKSEDEEKKEEGSDDSEDESKEEEDDDDKKKKDDYSLLKIEFDELKLSYDNLMKEVEELRQFKLATTDKEKDDLINEFFMLSDEDKQDVVDHKAEYTLDEIKSKLAVLCYEKKVSYIADTEDTDNMTVNVGSTETEVPGWIQAVDQHIGK